MDDFSNFSNEELRNAYTATVQEMMYRFVGDDLKAAEYLDAMGVEVFSRLLGDLINSTN